MRTGSEVQKTTRPKRRKTREAWGRVRKLPSGRHQAAYTGPDLAVHKAAGTFETLTDARAWLQAERQLVDAGKWTPPAQRRTVDDRMPTLGEYVAPWLADRPLKPSTRQLYGKHLRNHIVPTLGGVRLDQITPVTVRRWHAAITGGPTAQSHSYALLRTILATAVEDGIIPANPCHIRGAGVTKRVHQIKPATIPELEALIKALPERYGAMVLLGAWCGLRWGEITELRRSDLDLAAGAIAVRRAVTRIGDRDLIGTPKSAAGVRDVAIPPHILPTLRDHLDHWAEWGRDGLLFPAPITGGHIQHGTFFKTWDAARRKAGRPDLRFHDLRHTGAVLAAATGATLSELMARLGHSTVGAAMRYQHAAQDRDREIAALLSRMANGSAERSALT